jgi:hypothetical protein
MHYDYETAVAIVTAVQGSDTTVMRWVSVAEYKKQ